MNGWGVVSNRVGKIACSPWINLLVSYEKLKSKPYLTSKLYVDKLANVILITELVSAYVAAVFWLVAFAGAGDPEASSAGCAFWLLPRILKLL